MPPDIIHYCSWCGLEDDSDSCHCRDQDDIFQMPHEYCSDCGSLLDECNCGDEENPEDNEESDDCDIPHDCSDCFINQDCTQYRTYCQENNPITRGHSLIINPDQD